MQLGACLLLLSLLTVSLVGQPTVAVQWPRFRGPNGSGVSETDKPPADGFGLSSNRLWQAVVPLGHSSPAIWSYYIFVTAVENSTLVVIALSRRDGTLLWRQRAPSDQLEKVHPFSNPAASMPATDGQRVYTYFGSYGLLAHDFTGKEVWREPAACAANAIWRRDVPDCRRWEGHPPARWERRSLRAAGVRRTNRPHSLADTAAAVA